ncbi:ANTAR domain-containing protein [Siccirubricoccus sp. KC 17139]|uniref:ANTAR domain-containing protein n=1 Tax=Siccirubricoccus soli TaxID=2899147 RepID=A0ABT1D3D1_9PROT|nr:ANTAR domain-containing protein [Siccirubricoccus soli]MCO6416412.1 ANTAR domain-containing protein [Siccirubricoccus soli]MCP2682546.1 ANTAR domain-containing protein [Siccirubricoccus soli]
MERRTTTLRVLLVDSDGERAAAVTQGLAMAGCTVVAVSAGIDDLVQRVRDTGAEVIVCRLDDPSRDELEGMRALHRDEPRPVVLFTEKAVPEQIEAALEAGVAAYVVEGMAPARVRPVMEVAIRRFRAHRKLQQELAAARNDLAERKLVDRAKALLMRRDRLSEPEAYRRLRRMAMDGRKRLGVVAASLLQENRAS